MNTSEQQKTGLRGTDGDRTRGEARMGWHGDVGGIAGGAWAATIHSMSTKSTQHKYQQIHSINTKEDVLKSHGLPRSHSMSTKSTQLQYQQAHNISTKRGFLFKSWVPRVHSMSTNSTQHQYQQVHSINTKRACFSLYHRLPRVHGVSTNSAPNQC